MGKVIEVEARVGVTKNIGNYESVRLDYSARMVLNDDEKPGEMLKKLKTSLQTLVLTDVNTVTTK